MSNSPFAEALGDYARRLFYAQATAIEALILKAREGDRIEVILDGQLTAVIEMDAANIKRRDDYLREHGHPMLAPLPLPPTS